MMGANFGSQQTGETAEEIHLQHHASGHADTDTPFCTLAGAVLSPSFSVQYPAAQRINS